MKALFIITMASTLVACAGPQVNPQSSVDTAAKDDVVQLGPNLFQVLRKGAATATTELERSGTVAAAGVCVPKGKTVNITKKEIGYAPAFFGLQLSVLLTFSCE
jgi:hypothetical protein